MEKNKTVRTLMSAPKNVVYLFYKLLNWFRKDLKSMRNITAIEIEDFFSDGLLNQYKNKPHHLRSMLVSYVFAKEKIAYDYALFSLRTEVNQRRSQKAIEISELHKIISRRIIDEK